MGDLYYDVSEERSATFMVTESGLRGCWGGWKVFVFWILEVCHPSCVL